MKMGNSPGWKKILATRQLIEDNSCYAVGSGRRIRVFEDGWCLTDRVIQRPATAFQHVNLVEELFLTGIRMWDVRRLQEVGGRELIEKILAIRPLPEPREDKLMWMG